MSGVEPAFSASVEMSTTGFKKKIFKDHRLQNLKRAHTGFHQHYRARGSGVPRDPTSSRDEEEQECREKNGE